MPQRGRYEPPRTLPGEHPEGPRGALAVPGFPWARRALLGILGAYLLVFGGAALLDVSAALRAPDWFAIAALQGVAPAGSLYLLATRESYRLLLAAAFAGLDALICLGIAHASAVAIHATAGRVGAAFWAFVGSLALYAAYGSSRTRIRRASASGTP